MPAVDYIIYYVSLCGHCKFYRFFFIQYKLKMKYNMSNKAYWMVYIDIMSPYTFGSDVFLVMSIEQL